MIEEFLNEKPAFHTFLLSDIERYGFRQEFQTVYMQEGKAGCEGVFMKYFNNLILAGRGETLAYKEIAGLVSDEITTIMGNADIVERAAACIDKKLSITRNNLYIHKNPAKQDIKEYIHYAELKDADRIYDFLMSFPEFKNMYSEKGMLINRLRYNEGIHVFIEKEGRIIAHGNSAAAAEKTCMIGGICVDNAYRKKGYAKIILKVLCNYIHDQGKTPCIFAPEKNNYSIFKELGFEVYGKWGTAQITR